MQRSNNPYRAGGQSGGSSQGDKVPAPAPGEAPPSYQSAVNHPDENDSSSLRPPLDESRRRSIIDESHELPEGWIRQWDSNQQHHFYVDTKATPPRAIWVHPYDDPQYIASIPDTHPARLHKPRPQSVGNGAGNSTGAGTAAAAGIASAAVAGNEKHGHHGLFDKVKDKLAGTKEERDARDAARRRAEAAREQEIRRRYEERQQQIQQQGYPGQYAPSQGRGYGGAAGYGAGQQGDYQREGYQQGYQQPGYQQTGYQQTGYQQPGYGYQPQYAPPATTYNRGGGMGMGGMALPLIGGLAGGLLLGDMLDGGFGGGGGWGGDGGWGGGGGFGGDGGFF